MREGATGGGIRVRPAEVKSRVVAIVEWEPLIMFDPVTSLPQSKRSRGRVWKGTEPTAIAAECVDRVIGYFDVAIGKSTFRHCIDADF